MTKKSKEIADGPNKLNRISKKANFCFNFLFAMLALISIIPVIFIFMISISSEESIRMYGYRFIPQAFSAESYRFLFREMGMILRALGVSVTVTVVGTLMGLTLTTLMGYVLSKKEYRLQNFFTMLIFIPMIFNGGMLSSYVVNTQLLNLRDSIWVLILPLTVSSYNIVITKTFFKMNIPDSVMESAQIDGASQFLIFRKIALPLSKPLLATIALFLSFGFWNDWFQSSLYISSPELYSLQSLLDHVQRNIEMMAANPSMGISAIEYINSMPREGARMAMAILIIVPIACTYPFFQKYFISGLTIGAVKG